MDAYLVTTPFGRRSLSLGMVAAQAVAKACPADAAGHKWRVFRNLTEAKDRLGLSDRALAVLSALLTFHPDTALTLSADLVVFPSNRELSIRAHGPAPTTLRRALLQLVEAGVVIRRDSPNGKRYARKGSDGEVEQAFGFDLTPLIARAVEFEALANEVRAGAKARHLLREEISLHRRDIAKIIAIAFEEALPGPWHELGDRFRALGPMPPRSANHQMLAGLADGLRPLRLDVDKCLSEATNSNESDGNEAQTGYHQQNSKPDNFIEFEMPTEKQREERSAPDTKTPRPPQRTYPLGLVLQACPDLAMYARTGISNWRDLVSTADLVRRTLGVSTSAWDEARTVLGDESAGIVIACILQKGEQINSAGAYLRRLTELARGGKFSLGPMLMAFLRTKGAGEALRRPA